MTNPFPPDDVHHAAWELQSHDEPPPYMWADAEDGEDEPGGRLAKLRAALVDSAGLDDIPEPDPLIPGVFYRDSLAWIYGPPGCGKSFIAIDVAGCVGTGEIWQGFGSVTQGDVLYLVAEGVTGIKQRVRAWETAMGQKMTGVQFLPVAVQASQGADWDVFVELAREIKPALIVIDTQARVTAGMEENSAKEMGDFVRRVDQLRLATRACVLVIHHTGRNGDHMRGSIAMDGAATTMVKVEKSDTDITVKCGKQKDAEPFEDFHLRMVPMGESIVLSITDSQPSGGLAASLPWRRKWWQAHHDDLVSISVLVRTGLISEATFHRAKYSLIDAGIISREGKGNATRYKLLGDPDSL